MIYTVLVQPTFYREYRYIETGLLLTEPTVYALYNYCVQHTKITLYRVFTPFSVSRFLDVLRKGPSPRTPPGARLEGVVAPELAPDP